MSTRSRSTSRAGAQQHCDSEDSGDDCPICNPRLQRIKQRPEEPHDFKQMLSLLQYTLHGPEDQRLNRSRSRSNLSRKPSKREMRTARSVDSMRSPVSSMVDPPMSPFPRNAERSRSPIRYKLSKVPGGRAQLIPAGGVPFPDYESRPSTRDSPKPPRSILKNRNASADLAIPKSPVRFFENPRQVPTPEPRARSNTDIGSRFKEDFYPESGEMLMPVSYEPPRAIPRKAVSPVSPVPSISPVYSTRSAPPVPPVPAILQRLSPQAIPRKPSREENNLSPQYIPRPPTAERLSPQSISRPNTSERMSPQLSSRKASREENVMPRMSPQMTPRKSSREENVLGRQSPQVNSRPPIPERLSPPVAPRKTSREENLLEPPKVTRQYLSPVPEIRDESMMERGRPVARRDSERRRAENDASITSPKTKASPTHHTLPQTRYSPTKFNGLLQPVEQNPLEPEPLCVRKDSLDPMSNKSDGLHRVLRAIREIDLGCLKLFDECETLQTERLHLHNELLSVLNMKNFNTAHLSIVRQQQQDLVDLDVKIDRCVLNVMERQRRKTRLVDGLPEIQEMDGLQCEELEEGMDGEESPQPIPEPPENWGPRADSLPEARRDRVVSSFSTPKKMKPPQRGTVTYAEIMDFLDEFD